MFEFNPDLVQGDDQEAEEDTVLYSHREEDGEVGAGGEGRGGEVGEEEEEGRDITEMAGYLDEVVAPPPPPVQSSVAGSSRQAEAASGIIINIMCSTYNLSRASTSKPDHFCVITQCRKFVCSCFGELMS